MHGCIVNGGKRRRAQPTLLRGYYSTKSAVFTGFNTCFLPRHRAVRRRYYLPSTGVDERVLCDVSVVLPPFLRTLQYITAFRWRYILSRGDKAVARVERRRNADSGKVGWSETV